MGPGKEVGDMNQVVQNLGEPLRTLVLRSQNQRGTNKTTLCLSLMPFCRINVCLMGSVSPQKFVDVQKGQHLLDLVAATPCLSFGLQSSTPSCGRKLNVCNSLDVSQDLLKGFLQVGKYRQRGMEKQCVPEGQKPSDSFSTSPGLLHLCCQLCSISILDWAEVSSPCYRIGLQPGPGLRTREIVDEPCAHLRVPLRALFWESLA